jgi:hypothetical protein
MWVRVGHDPYWAEPIVGRGLRNYLGVLLCAPIGAAAIVGSVALLSGGSFLMPALVAAAVIFVPVLAMGLIVAAFQLWPLLLVLALVVWALRHWL